MSGARLCKGVQQLQDVHNMLEVTRQQLASNRVDAAETATAVARRSTPELSALRAWVKGWSYRFRSAGPSGSVRKQLVCRRKKTWRRRQQQQNNQKSRDEAEDDAQDEGKLLITFASSPAAGE
jgi:hypothetical protein